MRPGIMERIKAIRSHWYDGASAGYLGDCVGCSRNAIIGIYTRYRDRYLRDCPLRAPGVYQAQEKRKSYHKRRSPKLKSIICEPIAEEPESLNVKISDAGSRQCRYIAGDPLEGAGCCGHETVGGTSWCAFHLRVVVGAGTASEQSALRDARRAV